LRVGVAGRCLSDCQFRRAGDFTVTTPCLTFLTVGSGFSAIQNVTLMRVVAAGYGSTGPIIATIAGTTNGVTPNCQQQLSGRRTGARCELPDWREVPGTIAPQGWGAASLNITNTEPSTGS
jgi:hypothetical protein